MISQIEERVHIRVNKKNLEDERAKNALLNSLKHYFLHEDWEELSRHAKISYNLHHDLVRLILDIEVLEIPVRLSVKKYKGKDAKFTITVNRNKPSVMRRVKDFTLYSYSKRDRYNNYQRLIRIAADLIAEEYRIRR